MNPYKILGIEKDSSISEIKKAYKKLALKYHPDKNIHDKEDAEKKFKQISEAYQILSDSDKKKLYDNSGTVNYDFISPENLFNNFFKDVDPKIIKFITNTYSNITKAINFSENGSIVEVISNINSQEIFSDGIDALKSYLLSKKTNNSEKKYEKDYIYIIQYNSLLKNNNIYLDVEQYFNNSIINVKIIDNNSIFIFKLKTEFSNQEITLKNKKYSFKLIDNKSSKYQRINSNDLLINIEIGMEDYFEGFLLIFKFLDINIERSINLFKNKSLIIKLGEKGFPIWSENKRGDLYLNFIIKSKNRLHPHPISSYYLYSKKIKNVLNNLNLYD